MTILAIDPGPTESALVEWNGACLVTQAIGANDFSRMDVEKKCQEHHELVVAVEMVACYGMPVGREVFEACLQIGRIQEICARYKTPCRLIYRLQVKQHLCHDTRAKDSNIRRALVDRFGEPGTKKAPGKLYGIKSHLWSALAVAVYAADNPE